jgi:hypothetical protein
MSLHVNDTGVWKDTDEVYICDPAISADTTTETADSINYTSDYTGWKQAHEIYINDNGVWKPILGEIGYENLTDPGSSGMFEVPIGVFKIYVSMVGGGADATASGNFDNSTWTSGGSGGMYNRTAIDVNPHQLIAYTIGDIGENTAFGDLVVTGAIDQTGGFPNGLNGSEIVSGYPANLLGGTVLGANSPVPDSYNGLWGLGGLNTGGFDGILGTNNAQSDAIGHGSGGGVKATVASVSTTKLVESWSYRASSLSQGLVAPFPNAADSILTSVSVNTKYSNSACTLGSSYGITADRKRVWTDNGCRALFDVEETHLFHFDGAGAGGRVVVSWYPQTIQKFTESGSFTVPPGVFSLEVSVVGGQGGGGGSDGPCSGSTHVGTGGSGGNLTVSNYIVKVGDTFDFIIGTKGSNGAGGRQNSGGGAAGTGYASGGGGGNAGGTGWSGGGGGGGAATSLIHNYVLGTHTYASGDVVLVAAGGGGRGGCSNSTSVDNSAIKNSSLVVTDINTPANGVAGQNRSGDGGGGGGGGGGVKTGASGGASAPHDSHSGYVGNAGTSYYHTDLTTVHSTSVGNGYVLFKWVTLDSLTL